MTIEVIVPKGLSVDYFDEQFDRVTVTLPDDAQKAKMLSQGLERIGYAVSAA